MSRSKSWVSNTSALAGNPAASVLLRMMMSVNDIALAIHAKLNWGDVESAKLKARQGYAEMYFIRVMYSHVHEALDLIDEIKGSVHLMKSVERLDPRAIASFKMLSEMSTAERAVFKDIRNRATFHYDKQLPLKALNEIVSLKPDHTSMCTIGDDAIDWHFELGDEIINHVLKSLIGDRQIPRL